MRDFVVLQGALQESAECVRLSRIPLVKGGLPSAEQHQPNVKPRYAPPRVELACYAFAQLSVRGAAAGWARDCAGGSSECFARRLDLHSCTFNSPASSSWYPSLTPSKLPLSILSLVP